MTSTSSAVWNLLNSARGEVASSSLVNAVVAPTALLLALRWADEHDAEQSAIAAFNGEDAQTILPESLRWSVYRTRPRPLTAVEVSALWAGIRKVLGLPVAAHSNDDDVRLPSGRLLAAIVNWIDEFQLDTPAGRRDVGEAFTELVLQTTEAARFGGELVTPRAVARLMVALADPHPGERVYDPCFGTGGLLVEAAETIWNYGREVAPGEWTRVSRVPLFGVEKYAELDLVAFVRLLLAGVRPALEVGDALEREAAGRHQDQGFDCVLVDPPWGGKLEGNHLYDFPIRARSTENLFVQHAIRSLRPGGRAVVVLPPGLLFRGGADYELRRWLLNEYRVEYVLRLPAKTLRHTGITPSLLVVRRTPPAENVRFAEISSLPESREATKALVESLLATGDAALHSVRDVPVAELLKADARLVAETYDRTSDDRLERLSAAVELKRLVDVANIVPGVTVRRDAVVEQSVDGGLPLVRIGDLGEGVLRLPERCLRSDARGLVRDAQFVRRGDVLVSVDGTIGKVLFVQHTLPSNKERSHDERGPLAVAQKGLVIVRPRELLDPRFLSAVLASPMFQARLRSLARGGRLAHLPLSAVRELLVPVPPPAIQEKVLRRLSVQPGDAVEMLLATLVREEDPLAGLFRESSAIRRLLGDGIPEPEELYQLGLDAFASLRPLRNQAAHASIELEPQSLRWLITAGAVPIQEARRRREGLDFEVLEATRTMLDRAVELAREISGPTGKAAVRLTERLILWADAARARAASDFRLSAAVRADEIDGEGYGWVTVTVTLNGTAPLQDLAIWFAGESHSIAELLPGESKAVRVATHEDMWERSPTTLTLRSQLVWSGRRLDGSPAEGKEPLQIEVALGDANVAGEPNPVDLGASPFITGDVVDNPKMFFGRQTVIDDIRTHLSGGTKVILLEGNRRTGKTSILRQLQRPEIGLLDSWIPVECSFQGTIGDPHKDGIPTEGVFRLIVRDIGLACAKAGKAVPLPEMEPATDDINSFRFKLARGLNKFFSGIDPYEALQIYVDMVTAAIAPRRLLLMLDEFDKLQVGIDNMVTSPQVPENLRNLLQTRPRVSAILTGSRRLKRLREEYWSALFGFGHRIGVDPLEPDEVRELITQPVAGRLSFEDAAVDLVAAMTARQPYLVQSLCARVFELAKRHGWRRIRREEVLEAVSRMVRDNEHFQALWSYAETERRRFLMCLCNRLADGTERVNAALLHEYLDEAGIVVPLEHVDEDLKVLVELELVTLANTPQGPQYELGVPLMRRWIELNVDAEAQRRKALQEQSPQGLAASPARATGTEVDTQERDAGREKE